MGPDRKTPAVIFDPQVSLMVGIRTKTEVVYAVFSANELGGRHTYRNEENETCMKLSKHTSEIPIRVLPRLLYKNLLFEPFYGSFLSHKLESGS